MVIDLFTDFSIHALRRFVARKDQADKIFIHNDTNFFGDKCVLHQSLLSLKQLKLNHFCLQIEQYFSTFFCGNPNVKRK